MRITKNLATSTLALLLALVCAGPALATELPFFSLLDGVSISAGGQVDFEGQYTDADKDESDLTLSNSQLNIMVNAGDTVKATTVVKYEETVDDDSLKLDEAYVEYFHPDTVLSGYAGFKAGRFYVPFGAFNSAFITDSLTQDLADTRADAFEISWAKDFYSVSAGVFAGDVQPLADEKKVDSAYVNLWFLAGEYADVSFTLISDLAESNAKLISDELTFTDDIPAASVSVNAPIGPFTFRGEFVAAIDDVDAITVAGNAAVQGLKPRAWFVEVDYLVTDDLGVGVRYEESKAVFDNDERIGIVASYAINEYMYVSAEYLYSAPENNDEEVQTGTAQLTFSF